VSTELCPMCTERFGCDCEVLQAADALAKAVKACGHIERHWGSESCCAMCDALAAYEAIRGNDEKARKGK
jgi:hypothetical protein